MKRLKNRIGNAKAPGAQLNQERKIVMKTNSKIMVAVLSAFAAFSFATATQAQYRATGGDGITASPKLREILDNRAVTPPVAAVKAPMACALCKDEFVTRTDTTARGAIKPTVTVAKHLCNSCETRTVVKGQGKAQTTSSTQSCRAGETAGPACCAPRTAG
jgi:hypothetical protein